MTTGRDQWLLRDSSAHPSTFVRKSSSLSVGNRTVRDRAVLEGNERGGDDCLDAMTKGSFLATRALPPQICRTDSSRVAQPSLATILRSTRRRSTRRSQLQSACVHLGCRSTARALRYGQCSASGSRSGQGDKAQVVRATRASLDVSEPRKSGGAEALAAWQTVSRSDMDGAGVFLSSRYAEQSTFARLLATGALSSQPWNLPVVDGIGPIEFALPLTHKVRRRLVLQSPRVPVDLFDNLFCCRMMPSCGESSVEARGTGGVPDTASNARKMKLVALRVTRRTDHVREHATEMVPEVHAGHSAYMEATQIPRLTTR